MAKHLDDPRYTPHMRSTMKTIATLEAIEEAKAADEVARLRAADEKKKEAERERAAHTFRIQIEKERQAAASAQRKAESDLFERGFNEWRKQRYGLFYISNDARIRLIAEYRAELERREQKAIEAFRNDSTVSM